MTQLQKGRLYEISGGSTLPGGMLPVINFKGVSGTLNLYSSIGKPASLSEMLTETADDITFDQTFKFEGMVKYFAIAGTGTATSIEASNDMTFEDVGPIS